MAKGLVIRRFSVATFKNKLHYHGCGRCRGRYTCSCAEPGVDQNCANCIGGHPPGTRQRAWAPIECCYEHSRQANNDDRERYKLAGPGPWFVCTDCWRQQPIKPTRSTNV